MKTSLSICLVVCCFAVIGCQQNGHSSTEAHSETGHSDDHSSHHPETFEEAAQQIGEMGEEILGAFEGGTPDAAHGALHEIGHVIDSLPKLAAQTSMDEEATRTIDDATEKLMNAFGALDGALHGEDLKSVEEIREEFDWSKKQLDWALDQINGSKEGSESGAEAGETETSEGQPTS